MTVRFSTELKESTKDIHRQVETKLLMKELIKGRLYLDKYCHLLSGLLRIYTCLESALDKNSKHPLVSQFHFKELYRSESLKNDLEFFKYSRVCGCSCVDSIVSRINYLSENEPEKLIAYAYVRYLGDLSGGLFLMKKVVKSYSLIEDSKGSEFYQFPGIEDVDYFKDMFRNRLDLIPMEYQSGLLEETRLAFQFHDQLFDEMFYGCKKSCSFMGEGLTNSLRSFGIGHSHLLMGLVVVTIGTLIR